MKKYLFIPAFLLFCLISACSPQQDTSGNTMVESESSIFESETLIESGKCYRIYRENGSLSSHYEIFAPDGAVVWSETTDRPLSITMVTPDIADIRIGMGTGLALHRYYSIQRNQISETFSYVLASDREAVAYIHVPKENSFADRKVIVRNMFDKNTCYQEFSLDFSHVDTPVISAAFSEDGSSLMVTYLSGDEQEERTEILDLKSS